MNLLNWFPGCLQIPEGTYKFTLVRASHHIWRSAHQILMIFCTKLHLDESKKNAPIGFLKKFSFAPPQGGGPKIAPFSFFIYYYYFIIYWFPGCLQIPEGTYKFTLVRSSVRPFRSYSLDRSIFLFNFCMKLCLHMTQMTTKNFRSKNFLTPKWPKMVKIWPFLSKQPFLSVFGLYLPKFGHILADSFESL